MKKSNTATANATDEGTLVPNIPRDGGTDGGGGA